ncbi:MAG: recombinase family protein, partial [Acidimicrobiales bacterium]|nr:recombinase family protein [Acidimicrobiales bacterium]
TRRPIELEQFLEVLAAAKVRHVRFVSGADVDIANGDGLMVLRMMSAVAANESASKGRRVRRKLDEVAAAGRPHGGSRRPFGFEDDRITHRPDEAAIIRTIAARFIAGESLVSLARWLDDIEVRSVYNTPWRTTTVRDMLASARIAGLRRHRGEVVGPAIWEPIITDDDRTRILARIEQRRVTRERSPRSYLLSGMLRCSKCGHTLYSSRREHSRRYVCMSGPDHHGCGHLTIVAAPVEELITDAVLYRLDTPELAAILEGRTAADQQTIALGDTLANDRQRLDDLAQMWGNNEVTRAEWVTARKPIDARINETQRRLARITRTDALAGLIGNGTTLRTQWADLNLTRQHAIVKALLDHAIIAPGARGAREVDPNRVDPVWRV